MGGWVATKWFGEVGFVGGRCFEAVSSVFRSSEMVAETCFLLQ